MVQEVVVVNASRVLPDSAVAAKIGPLQTQHDRDFFPAWRSRATQVRFSFAADADIPNLPADAWAIFLNRHSTDPGALGWHDDQGNRIFSRVFVGDCLRFGLDWGVTLSHEACEMVLDPDIKRVWQMSDGRLAALEACDAVESDRLAYGVNGHMMSDFVLPSYFSAGNAHPYDYNGVLVAPCPSLAPEGYMSLTVSASDPSWTQIQDDRVDGLAGARALLRGHRRQERATRQPGDLEILTTI
jgi:hypothetical protein